MGNNTPKRWHTYISMPKVTSNCETVLIDEPLPRLPLTSQPIKVKLKMGGWGKPRKNIIGQKENG